MDSAPTFTPPSRAGRLLWLAATAIGYPPAFLVGYMLDAGLPFGAIPQGTNVTLPIFPILWAILALLAYARFRLWRLLRRWLRHDTGQDAWARFCLAHRPAALCLPLTLPLCFVPMEGNAFGLLIVPVLLLLTLTIGVWVQIRLWRRRGG
ncbi:MAG: hypothetical protein ACP59X_21635 [Solidesulfovibrio sp. DCME]|uniref:hypothetical protein n=1 Tax=Solidesulfovibrio sp. DCME TaxID=3447380 RepID=UPI003D0C4EF6